MFSVTLDPVITPENFAQSVVEDYNLASNYHAIITKSIQDQLSDFKAHHVNYDGDGADISAEDGHNTSGGSNNGVGRDERDGDDGNEGDGEDDGDEQRAVAMCRGSIDAADAAWWESWRKRLRTEDGYVKLGKRRPISVGRKKRKTAAGGNANAENVGPKASGTGVVKKKGGDVDRPMSLDEFDYDESALHEGMRILIKVGWSVLSFSFLSGEVLMTFRCV